MLNSKELPTAIATSVAIGIFLAMLWLYPWPSYPAQYEPAPNQQKTDAQYAPAPLVGAHQASGDNSYDKNTEEAITAWWGVRIAAIAVFVSVGQLILFWWQLGAMRKGLVDTAKQAKIAEETFSKIERPHVFLTELEWMGADTDRTSGLQYLAVNAGRIPAIIESVRFFVDPTTPNDFQVIGPKSQLQAGQVLLAEDNRVIRSWYPFREGLEMTDFKLASGAIAHIPFEFAYTVPKIRLIVAYRGPFTEGHETSALWAWDPGNGCFGIEGGYQYNYTK